jgi:hypothetical protein
LRSTDPYFRDADPPARFVPGSLINSEMMTHGDSALGYRVECGG